MMINVNLLTIKIDFRSFFEWRIWGGQAKKPSSKLGLDFSKKGFTTFSYTSLLSSNTKTSWPID
jgi:hypothetical protein